LFLSTSRFPADGGEVIQPPGFNMIFLPYADDVRNLKFEPTPIATDELIVDAKKIVEKLTVKSLSVDSRAHFTSHNGAGREGQVGCIRNRLRGSGCSVFALLLLPSFSDLCLISVR
jgi:hypothetical protein